MMDGSRLITQVLPVVTIILAVVFFLALKLIGRAKSRAMGEQTSLSLIGFQIEPETESQDQERRKIICPVLVEESRGVLKASLQELTLAGAFFTCPNPRPMGQTFQVRILIAPQESLKLEAEVLWNNKNVPADKIIHRGMRVRFLQLSPDDRKTLSEIVNKPRAEKLFTWSSEFNVDINTVGEVNDAIGNGHMAFYGIPGYRYSLKLAAGAATALKMMGME